MVQAAAPALLAPPRLRVGALDARFPAIVAGLAIALLPMLRPSLPGNSAPVDGAIVLTLLATLLWAGSAGVTLRLPYAVPVAIFVTGGLVAAAFSRYPAEGLLAVVQDLFVFLWCVALANLARSGSSMSIVLRAWAWSAIGWALLLIGALATGHQELASVTARTGSRASLTFGDANLAGSYFALAFMVVWAARIPRQPLLRTAGLLVLAVALLLTGSNGGILALAAGIGATLLIVLVRRAGAVSTVALVVPLSLVVILLARSLQPAALVQWAHDRGPQLVQESIGRSADSLAGRQLLFSEELGLLQTAGLIGTGPASIKPLLIDGQTPYPKQSHQDFLGTIIERGLLGGLGLLLLISSLAVRGRAALLRRGAALARAVPQPAALVGALVGVAVTATFYDVLHFRQVWALFAVVAAISLPPTLTLPHKGGGSTGAT
jgi:hypothetical protein